MSLKSSIDTVKVGGLGKIFIERKEISLCSPREISGVTSDGISWRIQATKQKPRPSGYFSLFL